MTFINDTDFDAENGYDSEALDCDDRSDEETLERELRKGNALSARIDAICDEDSYITDNDPPLIKCLKLIKPVDPRLEENKDYGFDVLHNKYIEAVNAGRSALAKIQEDKAVRSMARLVARLLVDNYSTFYMHHEDMFQVGCMAVVKALHTYNAEQGSASNYVRRTVQGEIREYLSRNVYNTSRYYFSNAPHVYRAMQELEKSSGSKNYTNEQLSEYLRTVGRPLPAKTVEACRDVLANLNCGSDEDMINAFDEKDSPVNAYLQEERKNALKKALGKISESDSYILGLRFGFPELYPMSCSDMVIKLNGGVAPDKAKSEKLYDAIGNGLMPQQIATVLDQPIEIVTRRLHFTINKLRNNATLREYITGRSAPAPRLCEMPKSSLVAADEALHAPLVSPFGDEDINN